MRCEPVSAVSVSGTRTSPPNAAPRRHRGRGSRPSPRRAAAVAAVQALESRTMLSASLVKDINATNADAGPQNFLAFQGELYFTANDGYHGYYGSLPWKTDGTVAGTMPGRLSLVPGAPDAQIYDPAVVNGDTLYFFARGPSDGNQYGLWKSDGTVAGTTELARFDYPSGLTNVNGTLYFLDYRYASLTSELVRWDGTANAAVPLAGFTVKGPSPTDFTAVGDKLFFSYVNSLWVSDGTPAGTGRVPVDVPPPGSMVDFNGRLFFTAMGTLWESDGTATGTQQVVTQPFLNAGSLVVYEGSLYFGAGGYSTPLALWKTDGTAADTVQVTAIPNGTSQLSLFAVASGTLFFAAGDSTHGLELWRSDGTAAGTTLVKDVNPGPGNGIPTTSAGTLYFSADIVSFNGKVFFDGNDGTHGTELWESDGTAPGTLQLGQINPTTVGSLSNNESAVTIGGITYFDANDGIHGNEVWRTDGTAAGTFLVADLTPGPWSASLYDVAGTLYIDAYDGSHNNLYASDGTAAGTRLIGPGLTTWYEFTPIGNSVYFVADEPGTNVTALYATDGTAAGTHLVTDALQAGVWPIANLNGTLYFIAYDAGYHPSLWRTDGASATEITAFAGTGEAGSSFLALGSELYFVVNDGADGYGLWKTDGTAAGTSMVWATGSSDLEPTDLYAFNGALYFTVVSETGTAQASGVYKTNGTRAGTVELTADTAVNGFTAASGQLFFAARPPGTYDAVLTVTDGTVAGTRSVGAGYQVDAWVNGAMMPVDGQLYFIGSTSQGAQLWQTDGTTTTLADPSEPANGWTPDMLLGQTGAGLVFAATDTAHGEELWDLPLAPSSSAASFVKSDAATLGNWPGTYGSDGYAIVGGGTSLPSYVSMDVLGSQYYQWAAAGQADGRAPVVGPDSMAHVAATDYAGSSFTVNLNFNDGAAHQVTFYLLDYDGLGRAETVTITNADTGQVLDARSVSNFQNGQYVVYTLSGHMKVTFTNVGGSRNAVLSGVLFDPAAKGTAAFAGTDTTTQGNWTGTYGTQGYQAIGGDTSLPPYASVSASAGTQGYEWASSATDAHELQVGPGSTSRVAACFYSNAPSFSLDVNLTDGQTHQVSLYLLDYDGRNRAESIIVSDAATGAVLDSRTFSKFANGVYARWNLSGSVRITITNAGGLNEVVSGIFIDPVSRPAATFVGQDAGTQGTWSGTYGGDGYAVFNAGSSLPAYATLNVPSTVQNYTWAYQTSESRGLQAAPGSSNRVAACDYSNAPSFTLDLNLTDSNVHRVALYFLDYDAQGRAETITISDANTGAVLDTQSVSNFTQGKYLLWNLSGHVKITIGNAGGLNEVLSGIFFG